ncbi:testican-2-like, partial [Oxyura jamaicensis]|uniref:testican-2-like n=1 Tax=Oxyura jamaicensis TaxID=8884 RepID=UPI0015A65957
MRGCGALRGLLALLLLLLPGTATGTATATATATGTGTGSGPAGNFLEDEQWLSSIAQYGGRIRHWNRFRDEVEVRAGRGCGA